MRVALWRGCLWWVCLGAAVRVATLAVAAEAVTEIATKDSRQAECEVLDLSKESPGYDLPTNLTVRPLEAGWRLDVTLGRGAEAAVCVRLEDKQIRLKTMALAGNCDGKFVRDYSYLNVPVALDVWTSLRVEVAAKTVIVSTPEGNKTSVATYDPPLSRGGTQVVVADTRKVEVAVGCRTNCPGYRHSAVEDGKKRTVKEWSEDRAQLYFRPGNKFMRLEYEVACITSLGQKIFPHRADITLDPAAQQLWHPVNLNHHSGLATVSLNHRILNNMTLPESCTFDRHIIRVVGDGLFSFSCNPFTGDAEGMEDPGRSVACVTTAQARMLQSSLTVIIMQSIALVLLLITVFLLVCIRYQQSLQTPKKTEEATPNVHPSNNSYLEK